MFRELPSWYRRACLGRLQIPPSRCLPPASHPFLAPPASAPLLPLPSCLSLRVPIYLPPQHPCSPHTSPLPQHPCSPHTSHLASPQGAYQDEWIATNMAKESTTGVPAYVPPVPTRAAIGHAIGAQQKYLRPETGGEE